MRKVRFEEDEMLIMAMFEGRSRKSTIKYILEATKYMEKEDGELIDLMRSTAKKLKRVSNGTFRKYRLSEYLKGLEDEENAG